MLKVSQIRNCPPIAIIILCVYGYELACLRDIFTTGGNYIKIVCVIIALIAYWRSPKKENKKSIPLSLRMLMVWICIIVFRGTLCGNVGHDSNGIEFTSYSSVLINVLANRNGFFALMMPFLVLLEVDDKVFSIFKWLALLFGIVILYNIYQYRYDLTIDSSLKYTELMKNDVEITIRILVGGVMSGLGMIVLYAYNYAYLNKKQFLILPIIIVFNFIFTANGAGRGDTFLALSYIIIFFFIQYKYPIKREESSSFLKKLFIAFTLIGFVYLIRYLYFHSDIFTYLLERIERTQENFAHERQEFENAMRNDFNSDAYSWFFGRGINGSYKIDGNLYRDVIEWGYLYLILKGGCAYLLLYVYTIIVAVKKGFISSQNTYCKALAFFCIIQVIALIPFGLPEINVTNVLLWYGVSILHQDRYLYATDDQMKDLILGYSSQNKIK